MARETGSGSEAADDTATIPEWRAYAREFPQWYVWRGVAGHYYARVPRSSPPRVVRALNPEDLREDMPARKCRSWRYRLGHISGIIARNATSRLPLAAIIALIMKRLLDPSSLRALARGCAVLGAGGGGGPYLGLLQALQATEDFGPVSLVDLDELPEDSLIMPCGGIGAPTVSIEKIENGDEGGRLREHLEFLTGRRVCAVMPAEIGGSNGLLPVAWAARMGLPVADADGMGRAFPEIPQVTMYLAGISPSPAVMTDERGNLVIFQTISGQWMERLERAAAVEFGGAASSTEFPMTAAQARGATVRNSVTLAIRIGEAVSRAAAARWTRSSRSSVPSG